MPTMATCMMIIQKALENWQPREQLSENNALPEQAAGGRDILKERKMGIPIFTCNTCGYTFQGYKCPVCFEAEQRRRQPREQPAGEFPCETCTLVKGSEKCLKWACKQIGTPEHALKTTISLKQLISDGVRDSILTDFIMYICEKNKGKFVISPLHFNVSVKDFLKYSDRDTSYFRIAGYAIEDDTARKVVKLKIQINDIYEEAREKVKKLKAQIDELKGKDK
jgi:hypothetical protein